MATEDRAARIVAPARLVGCVASILHDEATAASTRVGDDGYVHIVLWPSVYETLVNYFNACGYEPVEPVTRRERT